jgi:hypothetical protein
MNTFIWLIEYYEYANKESSRIKDDSEDENYDYATYEYDDYDAGPPGVLAVTTALCEKDANEECVDLSDCSDQGIRRYVMPLPLLSYVISLIRIVTNYISECYFCTLTRFCWR